MAGKLLGDAASNDAATPITLAGVAEEIGGCVLDGTGAGLGAVVGV